MPETITMTREEKLKQFGEGPWLDEPDRVEWRTEGFPCLLLRSPAGVWCGYLAVPPGHPWHGAVPLEGPQVHGGITFDGPCDENVCHVPAPGEPEDVYWLGFDCGHAFDLTPELMQALKPQRRAELMKHVIYRDVVYAAAEVEELAKQAARARTARG